MLQAWIVSPRESLYFAAAATPCSFRSLRRHVRRLQRHLHGRLHLTLHLGGLDVGVEVAGVESYLERLASAGVDVTLVDAHESSGHQGAPGNGDLARLAAARPDDDGDRSGAPPTILPIVS